MASPISLTAPSPNKRPSTLKTSSSNLTSAHQLLSACTSVTHFKQIHAQMIRSGTAFSPLTASHLVSYCTSQELFSLNHAKLIFFQIPNPTTFTFNSIIRAYTKRNLHDNALLFYIQLIQNGHVPDNYTFPSLFKCCSILRHGKELHCHAVKLGFVDDVYVNNTLMNMYADCGSLECARKVFDSMPEKSVVSWATIIAAYTKWNDPSSSLKVYREMITGRGVKPNEIVLVNTLTACARARDLEMVLKVNSYIKNENTKCSMVLWASLLDAYCKCDRVPLARKLFDEMPTKNLFCWNIMIKGHVEDGDYEEALHLFREMQLQGIDGDKITIVALVLACAHLGALELGRWLHLYIKRKNIEVDIVLGTSLLDMYAKCGCIGSAFAMFEEMSTKDLMTWTALIVGLATSGNGEVALKVFEEMQNVGIKPDAITFIGVLAACSHAGLIDKGKFYFKVMSNVYNITPTVEHYGCMVDLLARAGRIDEAGELISNMPMNPDYFVLGSLLSACRVHKNIKVAEKTARKILELDPKNGGTYVLLSNLYASTRNWDESSKLRKVMAEKNIRKPPGCSMIEIGGEVHEFVMGSRSVSVHIDAMVEEMMCRIRDEGYVPNKSEVLINIDEELKNDALCRHSEKLAIAFGLVSTRPGTPIRVMKNLRVCSDCHEATKMIAKVYGREIVVRDRFRFHHFKHGSATRSLSENSKSTQIPVSTLASFETAVTNTLKSHKQTSESPQYLCRHHHLIPFAYPNVDRNPLFLIREIPVDRSRCPFDFNTAVLD